LLVVEEEAAFTELFLEDLVLGAEVVEGLLLLAVDPACEDEKEKMPRLEEEVHGGPATVEVEQIASGLGPALSIG